MTTLEEVGVHDESSVVKDLFSGAVGGVAQVLIGTFLDLPDSSFLIVSILDL